MALVVSLRWKTAVPSSTSGRQNPSWVSVTDNVLGSDVFAVVVQRGVERICRRNLSDIPRWHIGASAESLLRNDFTVSLEKRTNSILIRLNCVFACVGLVVHTLNPTSHLEKLTNSTGSD